jgi:hypothetical protein
MPNQPGENTVATSFTLPRALLQALQRKAKIEMTNQSDIVRRALMNYLPESERASVLRELDGHAEINPRPAEAVKYKVGRPFKAGKASSSLPDDVRRAAERAGELADRKKKA